MCLAIPYQILKIDENSRAEIKVAGARQKVSLEILPDVKVGDWVLVNLGFAIAKIEENEAEEIRQLYQEIAEEEDNYLIGTSVKAKGVS